MGYVCWKHIHKERFPPVFSCPNHTYIIRSTADYCCTHRPLTLLQIMDISKAGKNAVYYRQCWKQKINALLCPCCSIIHIYLRVGTKCLFFLLFCLFSSHKPFLLLIFHVYFHYSYICLPVAFLLLICLCVCFSNVCCKIFLRHFCRLL